MGRGQQAHLRPLSKCGENSWAVHWSPGVPYTLTLQLQDEFLIMPEADAQARSKKAEVTIVQL